MKTLYITLNNVGLAMMLSVAYDQLSLHQSDRTFALFGILLFVSTRMLLSKKYY